MNTLLELAIEPLALNMSREQALKLVDLTMDSRIQIRIDELTVKANLGSLTEDERAEYDQFLPTFHVFAILRARAQRLLKT